MLGMMIENIFCWFYMCSQEIYGYQLCY